MSKVIKKDSSDGLRPFEWRTAGKGFAPGVRAFSLREASQDFASGGKGAGGAGPGSASALPPLGQDDLSAPERDFEKDRKQAFEKGYAEGQKAAGEQAEQRFAGAMESFARTVQELALLKPRLRREAERELVALSFAIARRVLRRELTVDPQSVTGIVRACLEEFGRLEVQRLRVNPRDLEIIRAYFENDALRDLSIVADPLVSPGGAIFQTAQGELDARVETQLEEIKHGLADQ